ncbi:MAG: hypothetical protein M1822_003781 [Bathelium mastoideum]|nr:MAG: hypothetical protein M1822_003781 [Bathelium mastoideum]
MATPAHPLMASQAPLRQCAAKVPSNFYYTTSISPQADGNTYSFTGCISSYDSSTSVLSRSGSVATASASVGPGELWGQPITVMNQQSDLSLFSTSATSKTHAPTPAASATTVASSTSSPPALETSTSAPANTSSGLSTGAAVGIGVGVGLGVLLLLAIVGFIWWRRRRNNGTQRLELDGRQVQPPPMTNGPPQELDAQRAAQELEGSYAPVKHPHNTEGTSAYNQTRTKRWRPRSAATPIELPT